MSWITVLQSVLTLESRVEGMAERLGRLQNRLENHAERIVRLETLIEIARPDGAVLRIGRPGREDTPETS